MSVSFSGFVVVAFEQVFLNREDLVKIFKLKCVKSNWIHLKYPEQLLLIKFYELLLSQISRLITYRGSNLR